MNIKDYIEIKTEYPSGESNYVWSLIEGASINLKYWLKQPRRIWVNKYCNLNEYTSLVRMNIDLLHRNGRYVPLWHIMKARDTYLFKEVCAT